MIQKELKSLERLEKRNKQKLCHLMSYKKKDEK